MPAANRRKKHSLVSVHCSFLFPIFVFSWWRKLGRQAATASGAGTLPTISMKATTYIILVLFVVVSCKQAEAPAEEALPLSTFDSPFPKNNKQLNRIFGDKLLIKSNNDTLILKITSNKNNNLITEENGDTIFFGKVCKYRDFYYFNYKVDDTSYYISAFKIKGNVVYGLNRWKQYHEVDENILKGNYRKNVKSISSDSTSIRLHTNKSELKKLFTLIMSDIIPDTILNSKSELNTITKNLLALEKEENDIESYLKVYPNPATDFIDINLNKKSYFQLFDFNGKIVLQGKLNELENRIDISNQKPGMYFLEINDIEKTEKKTVKVWIK